MHRIERVESLIFDLDGTLLDSFQNILEAFNHALCAMGVKPLREDDIRRNVGVSLKELMERYLDPADVQRGIQTYRRKQKELLFDGTYLMPQARAVLTRLYRERFHLGVVTNKPGYMARAILQHYGLHSLFGVVLGIDEVERPKPYGDGILEAARRLGISSPSVLYVGDSLVDVAAAKDAGVPVAIVQGGAADSHALNSISQLRGTIVIPNLAALLDLVGLRRSTQGEEEEVDSYDREGIG